MSDEINAVLQFVKSIDDRTARMESKQDRQFKDHDDRISTIESDHKVVRGVMKWGARIAVFVLIACGAGGAAKGAGLIDKLTTLIGSGQ
jgi:hypothetical protein